MAIECEHGSLARSCLICELQERIRELERHMKLIRELVDKQAEDEGLWFIATQSSEGYLQQELRKLHRVIEEE